jgi:hypothetical protein
MLTMMIEISTTSLAPSFSVHVFIVLTYRHSKFDAGAFVSMKRSVPDGSAPLLSSPNTDPAPSRKRYPKRKKSRSSSPAF